MFSWLENLIHPFAADSGTPPSQNAWRFIRQSVWSSRYVLAASVALTIFSALLEIWLIYYSARLVDLLASADPQQFWAEMGWELAGAALLLLLVRPVAAFFSEGLDDIAFLPNATTNIRWHVHRHVLNQSVGWFRDGIAGSTANHLLTAGSTATGIAYSFVHTLSYVTVYIVGSAGLMASIDPRLVLPLAVWVLLFTVLAALTIPLYRKRAEIFQNAYSNQLGMIVDTYSNIDTIKLFANRRRDDRVARDAFEAARQGLFGIQRVEVTVNTSMIFLGSVLTVGLVGMALFLWQSGQAPIGIAAAAVALSFRITGMAEWFLDSMSSLFGSLGALREALKTVAEPLDIADAPDARDLTVSKGEIRFENLSHHYGKGIGGLDHLTLDIGSGEKVGLVGRSGAGKSTLVNLLLRFFEAESGDILIDGQSVRAVTQESLRRQIAMVTQDATLLNRSIRENIAYGNEDISQQEIEAAAKKAEAHEFILGLKDRDGRTGYDATVGERGVKLSGGQRQRIALTRTILKDAPILILDEATSALDSEVEAIVQDTLYGLMDQKTVIAIAHRLSTIAHMDRIVVLDQGKVAEQGTHAQLLDQKGIYARLWSRQSGGYLGSDTE